ncbi:MAG: hypothetical protein J6N52_00785 [Clostridia bacterium]|nr:hypothetical protein [Clostridia bacterium]
MTKFTIYDLIGYILKHKWFVLIFVVAVSLCGFFFVDKTQTYTAQVVIKFSELNTDSGYLNQGAKLDVYEIISPRIVSEAIQKLGINENVEDIRSKCTVIGIVPKDIQELKEAKQKEGEEFAYYPQEYTLSYTADSDKPPEYARDIADAILTTYTKYYSNTYLSTYSLPEIKFDTVDVKHDYLETVEIINTAVEDCTSYFDSNAASDPDFRSPRTGYTFSNMSRFYSEIKNYTLPTIFSQILSGHITKNNEVLLKTYQYKREQALLSSDSKWRNSTTAMNLMDQFVEANKAVPSSYGEGDDDDDKYHAYDVYERNDDHPPFEAATYDQLINNYVVDGVSAGEFVIDGDYYGSICNIFSSPVPDGINQGEMTKRVENEISEVVDSVSALYDITYTFMDDYKRHQLTSNINMLTNITTNGNNPEDLFRAIIVVISILTACVAAVTYEIVMLTKKNKKKSEAEEGE